MKLLHSIVRNRLSEERVNKLLFIQINLRILRRMPKVRKPPSQSGFQDQESDGSDTEDAQDCSPYQLVPLIVQRVSQDSQSAGAIPVGPVQPTLPRMRQLELASFGGN